MAKKRLLDVLLWAHPDQADGIEIPCILASALRKRTGDAISCAIWTPFPNAVVDFFKLEGGTRGKLTILSDKPWLALEKANGRVDGAATRDYVQHLMRRNWQQFVKDWAKRLRPRFHANSLVISCGDPLAIGIARE